MPIRNLLQKSSQTLLDFFLPPHCLNCKTLGSWLCQDCIGTIALLPLTVCEHCGEPQTTQTLCPRCLHHPLQSLDGVRAASYFENNPIRVAIHGLKYQNHRAIASVLSQLLIDAYQRYELKTDVIIPVPLHPARLKERGYNQSTLLAVQMGEFFNLPVNNTTLCRIRQTRPQVGLGIDERKQNVEDAFQCIEGVVSDQNVLLVDDVWTTGATMNACALALKRGGASSVWGLTLARAGVGSSA